MCRLCHLTFYGFDCQQFTKWSVRLSAMIFLLTLNHASTFHGVEASNPLRCRGLKPAGTFWTLKCISVTFSGSVGRSADDGLQARSGYDAMRTTFRSACGIHRRRSLHWEPLVGRRSSELQDRFCIYVDILITPSEYIVKTM